MEQENSIKEFDLKVKSLLADAEEPVPAGAWEGIAARLAAAAPLAASPAASAASASGTASASTAASASSASAATKVPMWVWLRRAGVATAAVAASAALFLTLRESPDSAPDSVSVPLAEVIETPSSEPVESTETPSAELAESVEAPRSVKASPSPANDRTKAAAAAVRKEASAKTGAPRVEVVRDPEPQPQLAQALQTEVPSPAEEVSSPAESAASEAVSAPSSSEYLPSAVEQKTGGAVNDWEQLAREEERARSRKVGGVHLAACTNAMSNFITGNVNIAPMRTTGGGVPDHSYVTENGEVSYSIPLTFGVNVTYDLAPHWSIGLGLNYTRLSRSFAGTWNERLDDGSFKPAVPYDNINNIQQFIGIPVTTYYHIIRTERINLYVHAGGMVEKCLGNTWTANARELNYTESVKGAQLSVGAGIGVDFMLAPFVSLYLDPDVKYYFALNQPKSIRTKQPFMLGFELGVRFHL